MHPGGDLSRDEAHAALRRLEAAVAAHQRAVDGADGAEPAPLAALRQHLDVMREEVERLRRLLGA